MRRNLHLVHSLNIGLRETYVNAITFTAVLVVEVINFSIEYDTQTPQEENKSETMIVMLITLSPIIIVHVCIYVCFLVSYDNDILHTIIRN